MQQQTWVTLLGFAGFAVALASLYFAIKRDLKAEFLKVDSKIDGVRTDLKTQIGDSHADLKTDIAKSDARLTTLESRLYDIAMRLPTASAPARSTAS